MSLPFLTAKYKARLMLSYWSRGGALPLSSGPQWTPLFSMTIMDRVSSSSLRWSCLCSLNAGLKNKPFWNSIPGRTTEAEDTEALLSLKWETSRKDHSHNCKMYCFSCGNWLRSQRDSKRAMMGCRRSKEGKKVKKTKMLSTKNSDLKLTM